MKDEWLVAVDIFDVELAFETSMESGACLVESDCGCDRDEGCRHERIAEAKVRHVFADEDWEWEDERGRLGLPDEDVEVVEAPSQWRGLIDSGDRDETADSNTITLGSIWSAVR
ncbi:hypothetical protein [Halorussus salinisoli]|uniref:hypothetical protein n=1 Tax=Halorussus salinisoli TaxID=2558242 RepID=UPI0010C216AC|nr:hypothetical protein [Halorussus salinisoli]